MSHDRFNPLTQRAEVGENALRQLDQEAALQLKTHRNDPALRAMQDKIRAALSDLRPTPRYTRNELLARVPAEGVETSLMCKLRQRVARKQRARSSAVKPVWRFRKSARPRNARWAGR